MLDWLVNIPLYGIAIMMLGIALYCGAKEDRDE